MEVEEGRAGGGGGGGRARPGLVVGVVDGAWMCSAVWNVWLLEKRESSLNAPIWEKGDANH